MRRLLLIVGLCIVVALTILGWLGYAYAPRHMASSADVPARLSHPVELHGDETARVAKANDLGDFKQQPVDAQLAALSSLRSTADLDPARVDQLLEALRDRSLPDVVRNEIANVLLIQAAGTDRFEAACRAMVADDRETMRWREYVLQFLAELAPRSQDRSSIADAFWSWSTTPSPLRATALMHAVQFTRDATWSPERCADYFAAVRALAGDATAISSARTTAISLLRNDGSDEALVVLRQACRWPDASLRRVACSTLGHRGSSDDAALLRQCASDEDPLVAQAARTALAALAAAPPQR